MGYFANLFAKAAEIDQLNNELTLLRSERDKAQWEAGQFQDEIRAERAKRDRDANKYLRILTTKFGSNGNLFIEERPPVEPLPQFTPEQEAFITSLAQDMVQEALDHDEFPKPLKVYVQSIRDHSEDYLPLMK